MTNDVKQKNKPGSRLMPTGVVVLVLGFILLIVNLTNPVTNYVAGVGLVESRGPSAGSLILIVAGLLLAAFGFARRVLASIEKN
jgi:hypothetical protein